ncbi:hypothetical protein Tsubulata_007738 [Turnera subulata]|uniref:Two-component response regulator-like APRR7 n=1 Tax=Turnera subulata TaxID=218843 RepID=A0A9Q0F754_9ROSI|nr:hypothetical protein Tsubulata_007738 [Turnera subulata]
MSVDGKGDKDLTQINDKNSTENKQVEHEIVTKEGDSVGDSALKVNENVEDGHGGALQTPAGLQMPHQQQSNVTTVCWERFLHLRSLKVLLVENDDSTRHIVGALLRNCSYDVVEAENGLQAWKILEDLTNHIDLVLTEVAMPCISGIGLLHKIMSHKTRKNIPVIMMSSHDSMGLVFKCLSKGAVDFLVKPVRKNELKNLWQHVWRRCHSSSGSGSESGTQTQKSAKSKSIEQSDNNTGSNDDDDDESVGLYARDGSDHGSGTQSSWTKQAVEADSPRVVSPLDQVAECPDSTCAQVIHSNAEVSNDKLVHTITAKERQEQDDQLEKYGVGAEREISEPGNLDLQLKRAVEDPPKLVHMRQTDVLESGCVRCSGKIDGQLDLNSVSPSSKFKYEAVPQNTSSPNANFEAPIMHSKISDIRSKSTGDTEETAPLECSLKRCRVINDVGTEVQDDRNVLRRSDSSAFSRYTAPTQARSVPAVNIKSGSPHDTSLDVLKNMVVYDIHSDSNGGDPNQCSNVGSNNIDMGSTTNNSSAKSFVLKNNSSVMSTVKCSHPLSAFQSTKSDLIHVPQHGTPGRADEMASTILLAQQRSTRHELQIQHQSHQYDHCHLLHGMKMPKQNQLQLLPADHDVSSSKKMAAAAPQCGSSNVLDAHIEGNAGNNSVNRSASGSNHGSNHGSNGQNGTSTVANPGGTNIPSDNGPAGKSGSGDASGSGSGNILDESRFTQREAALTKFRQKRKERCFRKKVRYQSRKRLAEQRPRVRGQFVRQVASDSTSKSTES